MKVYTCSEARQRLSEVLDMAMTEQVLVRHRSGQTFLVSYQEPRKSPFDVPGIKTGASTQDILDAVRESRER